MFLTTHAVALRLGLTCDAVRWHERQGHLQSIKVQRSPDPINGCISKKMSKSFARSGRPKRWHARHSAMRQRPTRSLPHDGRTKK